MGKMGTELIDKFFANELEGQELRDFEKRLAEDEELQKEVFILKKLREGIEQIEDANLRERIVQYEEKYDSTPTTFLRPTQIGWVSGIAASILIVGVIYVNFKPDAPIELSGNEQIEDPEVPQDTIRVQPHPIEDRRLADRDSSAIKSANNVLKKHSLAMGGQTVIPAQQVMILNYPQSLKYAFDGKNIALYGDPLIPALQMDVFKNKDNYYLSIKGNLYEIGPEKRLSQLEPFSGSLNLDSYQTTEDELTLKFADIISPADQDTNLEVKLVKTMTTPTYYFENNQGNESLVIIGNFDPEGVKVYTVNHVGGRYCFALINGDLYRIPDRSQTKQPMERVNFSRNDLSRIFQPRQEIKLPINIIKN